MAGDPSLLTSSLTAALSKGCSSSTSHAFPHLEASSLVAPLASNTVSPDLPQISPHSQVASSCHSTPVLMLYVLRSLANPGVSSVLFLAVSLVCRIVSSS